MEKEQGHKLPFLDVLNTKMNINRLATNFKKTTDTYLLANCLSFIPTRCELTWSKHQQNAYAKLKTCGLVLILTWKKTKLT